MSEHPAKTQISLGIRPVWSESSLSAWRKLGPVATHWAHSEDWSDWADAQADLSLRWVHSHAVGFVTRRLILDVQTYFYSDYVCCKWLQLLLHCIAFWVTFFRFSRFTAAFPKFKGPWPQVQKGWKIPVDVKISIFLNIFRNNEWILIKFCLCIDVYMIHVVTNTHYFPKLFNSVMTHDWF